MPVSFAGKIRSQVEPVVNLLTELNTERLLKNSQKMNWLCSLTKQKHNMAAPRVRGVPLNSQGPMSPWGPQSVILQQNPPLPRLYMREATL